MIRRRQPLLRTGEIARASPLRTKTPLERMSRLRSSGPVKAKRRDTGPSRPVRLIVRQRAQDKCEACRSDGTDIHHRRPRAMGGTTDPATNRPPNLVLLCRQCHRWFESHRTVALELGWLVLQGHDPALVPLTLWSDRQVLLDDLGTYQDYQEARHG